jgi:hypothetical protein
MGNYTKSSCNLYYNRYIITERKNGTRTKRAKCALNAGNGRAILTAKLDRGKKLVWGQKNYIIFDGLNFPMFFARRTSAHKEQSVGIFSNV